MIGRFIQVIRRLLKGGLNFDISSEDMSPEDYRGSLNLHNGIGRAGKYFKPQNIEGNRLVNFTLPAGDNTTIGWLEDYEENTLIYFVKNSLGNHSILRYYPSTGLITPILQDPLLDFDKHIANKNLINGLLSWVDGETPREFNVNTAQRQDENGVFRAVEFNIYFDFTNFRNGDTYSITYSSNTVQVFSGTQDYDLEDGVEAFVTSFNLAQSDFTAESCGTFVEVKANTVGIYDVELVIDPNTVTGNPSSGAVRVFTNIYPDGFLETFINADKNPPICNPTLTIKTDITQKNNFVEGKVFQFRTSYFYTDGYKSALSPISSVPIGIGNYVEVDFSDTRLNDESLTIIKGVGIYVQEGELGKWKFVKELSREDFGVGQSYFNFFNDKEYSVVDDFYADKLYDSIPVKAGAQELFDNRKGLADITEGYDRVCVDTNLSISYTPPPELYTIKGIIVLRSLYDNTRGTNPFPPEDPLYHNAAIFNNNGTYFYGRLGTQVGQSIPLAGFVAYLAGTEFYGVSKQKITTGGINQDTTGAYNFNTAGIDAVYNQNHLSYSTFKSNDPYNLPLQENARDQYGAYIGDKFFANQTAGTDVYSTFEIFGVPAGDYIIRFAGVETTANDLQGTGYQSTSCYTMAVGNAASSVSPVTPQGFEYKISVGANVISHDTVTAENANNVIYVGCSSIADLSISTTGNVQVITGYICDSDLPATPTNYDEVLQDTRIERALVTFNNPFVPPLSFQFNTTPPNWSQRAWINRMAVTDHNGFFYGVPFITASLVPTKINSVSVGSYFATVAQGFFENSSTPITFATNYGGYNRIDIRNGDSNVKELSKTYIDGLIFVGTSPQENVPVTNLLGSSTKSDQIGYFKIPTYIDTYSIQFNGMAANHRVGQAVFSSLNNTVVYDFLNGDSLPVPFYDILIQSGNYNAVLSNVPIDSRYFHLFNIPVDLLEQFLGVSGFKRGLAEEIGVIYYDRENRQTTVNDHIRKIYVPFYTESQVAGSAQINWEITSLPPDWATHFQFVRTHSVPQFLQFNATSVNFVDVTDQPTSFTNATFIKIGFNSLLDYHNRYPNSDIGYTFNRGDRIKLISNGAGALFTTYLDAEVVKDDTQGSNYYIYVDKNSTAFIPDIGTLFEIYTPKPASETTFFEFGECFEIYELDGVKYHRGLTQDQTASQPATGTFRTGNVFYRFRNFVLGGAKYIEDSSVSDFYSSLTTQTGRPQILDKNAKQVHLPTAIRISNNYLSESNNGFSAFEALNIVRIDESYGAFQYLKLMSQNVLLGICTHRIQPFYVGRAVIKTTTGSNLISIAEDILNTADTLEGQRGTQHPQSIDWYNNHLWGWDNSKGVWWRYSSNGLEDISRYGAKSYFITKGALNIENIVSVFDPEHCNLIAVFQGNDAIGFNDSVEGGKNRWTSRYSYAEAEMVGRIGNQLLMLKDGALWINDSAVRNSFFGTQYTSSFTIVANDNPNMVKSFQAVTEESRYVWSMVASTPAVNTSAAQQTRLLESKFKRVEGKFVSEILNDMLTPNFQNQEQALINGHKMRGYYLEATFENNNTDFSELYAVNIKYVESPLND